MIRSMSKEGVEAFLYWVYCGGVRDGKNGTTDFKKVCFGDKLLEQDIYDLIQQIEHLN